MQCPCGENIVLTVNTETGLIMGYCPGCRKTFDIDGFKLEDEALADIEKRAQPLKKGPESLFYLRCTGILK